MNELKRAIDTDLSSLRVSERERAAILENAMEGKKVKKKLSVAFVLVLALVLAATAALAVALLSDQYFVDVATMQFEHGYYDEWSLEEKLAMLQLMKDYDVTRDDAETDALLSGGMPDDEREARIDAMMAAKYGINGRIDVISLESILNVEWGGDIETWTMEQKAKYTQILLDTGLMGSDDDIFRMPGEDVISPEEAVSIAKAEIARVWDLTDADLKNADVNWVYLTHTTDKEEKRLHYDIRLSIPGDKGYYCSVGNDGAILTSQFSEFTKSPEEEKALAEGTSSMEDVEVRQMIHHYAEAHGINSGALYDFPVADKAACLALIKPVILQHMAEDPAYSDPDMVILATRSYGVPDDKALTEEQALDICRAKLPELTDITAEVAATIPSTGVIYDVSDPSAPLWRFQIRPAANSDFFAAHPDNTRGWRMVLNAYTGEMVEVTEMDYHWASWKDYLEGCQY